MNEARLQEMLDRQAISDTVIRYATGIDMRQWDVYRSCFCDRVDIDFTSFSGGRPVTVSADDWVLQVRSTLSGFAATQHMSTNHVISVSGDEATCVSYMQAQHYLPNDKGGSTLTLGGYYTNSLVRIDEGWKIRRCQLSVTWTTGNRHIFELAKDRFNRGIAG